MCLQTKSKDSPPKTGEMYKLFKLNYDSRNGILRGLYRRGTRFKRGAWNTASKGKINMGHTANFRLITYPTGFHGFQTLQGALRAAKFGFNVVIIKCRYTGGHTQGSQMGGRTTVASKIYIPKNPVDLSKTKRRIPRI